MPQDYPNNWFTQSKKPSTIEKWVLELQYNNGYQQKQRIFFGMYDSKIRVSGTTYSVYGILTALPSVSESISIYKGRYKSSDCSFTIQNRKINFKPFSDTGTAQTETILETNAILFGGAYNFINRSCSLYSYFDSGLTSGDITDEIGVTDLSDAALLYTGRILEITHNKAEVNIASVTERPYDWLTIPSKLGTSGQFYPVAYGDFTHEESTTANPQIVDSAVCFPIPIDKQEEYIKCLLPQNLGGTFVRPHLWNVWTNSFAPIEPPNGETFAGFSDVQNNHQTLADGTQGKAAYARNDLLATYKSNGDITPDTGNCTIHFSNVEYGGNNYDGNDWTTTANQLQNPFGTNINADSSVNTSANIYWKLQNIQPAGQGLNGTNRITRYFEIRYKYPSRALRYRMTMDWYCALGGTLQNSANDYIRLTDVTGSATTNANYNQDIFYDIDGGNGTGTYTFDLSSPASVGNFRVKMEAEFTNIQGNNMSAYVTFELGNFGPFLVSEGIDMENEPTGSATAVEQMGHLYCGADGKVKSYNGGSGSAIKPHEIHRDLLADQTGWDTTDANLEGWNELDTARNSWICRYASAEPEKVKDIIDNIAYEGGFVFKMRPSRDNTKKGRYIFVKDSYNGNDINYTISANDLDDKGINAETTKFADLVTYRTIKYDYNHGSRKYQEEKIAKNATTRTKYDIRTEENKEDVTLEALTTPIANTNNQNELQGTANAAFANYYNNINGDVKILIKANVVNPKFFGMECGDIINFKEDLNELGKCYSHEWNHIIFMVTKVNRGYNEVGFEAIQVQLDANWVIPDNGTFPAAETIYGKSVDISWWGNTTSNWTIFIYKNAGESNESTANTYTLANNSGTSANSYYHTLTIDLDASSVGPFTDIGNDGVMDDGPFQIKIRPTSEAAAEVAGGVIFNLVSRPVFVWPLATDDWANTFFIRDNNVPTGVSNGTTASNGVNDYRNQLAGSIHDIKWDADTNANATWTLKFHRGNRSTLTPVETTTLLNAQVATSSTDIGNGKRRFVYEDWEPIADVMQFGETMQNVQINNGFWMELKDETAGTTIYTEALGGASVCKPYIDTYESSGKVLPEYSYYTGLSTQPYRHICFNPARARLENQTSSGNDLNFVQSNTTTIQSKMDDRPTFTIGSVRLEKFNGPRCTQGMDWDIYLNFWDKNGDFGPQGNFKDMGQISDSALGVGISPAARFQIYSDTSIIRKNMYLPQTTIEGIYATNNVDYDTAMGGNFCLRFCPHLSPTDGAAFTGKGKIEKGGDGAANGYLYPRMDQLIHPNPEAVGIRFQNWNYTGQTGDIRTFPMPNFIQHNNVNDDFLAFGMRGIHSDDFTNFVGDSNSNNQFARPIIDVHSPTGITGPQSQYTINNSYPVLWRTHNIGYDSSGTSLGHNARVVVMVVNASNNVVESQSGAQYNDGAATWSVSSTGSYFIVVRLYDIDNYASNEWSSNFGAYQTAEFGGYSTAAKHDRYFWGKSANFSVTSGGGSN